MSLLLASGHPHATQYPVAVVWSEARIVRQRQALRLKQEMALMQLTIGSVMDKKVGKLLIKQLARLDERD